jgi:hypothetical protein
MNWAADDIGDRSKVVGHPQVRLFRAMSNLELGAELVELERDLLRRAIDVARDWECQVPHGRFRDSQCKLIDPIQPTDGVIREEGIRIAVERDNLGYITQEANRKKGGKSAVGDRGSYVDWVGPNFRSVYAEGGKPNAKTIDGEPFTDAAGNPIR